MEMMKKTLVFLLGLSMVLTLFTGTVFAEDVQNGSTSAVQATVNETAAGSGAESMGDSGILPGTAAAGSEAVSNLGTAAGGSEAVSNPGAAAGGSEAVSNPGAAAGGSEAVSNPGAAAGGSEAVSNPGTAAAGSETVSEPGAAAAGSEAVSEPETTAEEPEAVTEPETTAEEPEAVSEPETEEKASGKTKDKADKKEESSEEKEETEEETSDVAIAEGFIEVGEAISVSPTFGGTDDSDELLMDYIDVTLGTNVEPALSAANIERYLQGADKAAYDVLKGWVSQIAKGEITVTETKLTGQQLGLKDAYTKADLGVSSLGKFDLKTKKPDISAAALEALKKYVPEIDRVNTALLFACPYDLYWYDKSTDGAASYVYSYGYHYNTNTGEILDLYIPDMTFRFAVSEDYADTSIPKKPVDIGDDTFYNYYNLDTGKLSIVQTALNTIRGIVAENTSKSAYEKLKAYKDKIDELVDYHPTAMPEKEAGIIGYGNPWQLIWVFDNDPSTKVVCEGYSKAFQYLFDLSDMSGIDCRTVTGDLGTGDDKGEAHMWNIVTMEDGKNYLVDVTNCDNDMIGYPYELFLVGMSGSWNTKYSRQIDSRTVTFAYDNDTRTSYSAADLTLSSANYDPSKAPKSYLVTFVDDNGKVLKPATAYFEGTKAADIVKPANPTKAADSQYAYTFKGWTPAIADVTGDVTYKATYTKTAKKYTVTWKNEDGTVLKTEQVAYGTKPSYTGTTPKKAATAKYSYTFAGWSPQITAVTKNVTYKATYKSTVRKYTVTWKNYDGKVLKTEQLAYGTKPAFTGVQPKRSADAKYTYTFKGWTPGIASVTKNATYTAAYTSKIRTYTVTWKNVDGTVLKTTQVAYGKVPSYGGTPTYGSKDEVWKFEGWNPGVKAVTGNATYEAVYQNQTFVPPAPAGFTGLRQATNGNWYYLRNGKVDFGYNSVTNNEYGWWYVKNGKVDFSYTGVAQNENGWWKITNGKVDFTYTGFERNENGWWYLENGMVSFGVNNILYGKAHTDQAKAGEYGWWLVRGSKVMKLTTVAPNPYGWWYVKNGKVDFSYNGVANNENGWWAIIGGAVQFNYHGFLPNEYGWWYLENGMVSFAVNDIQFGKAHTDQAKAGEYGWWLVRGSKVTKQTTVAPNANGWWYVKDGKVDFGYSGVANNEYGWWAIINGKVDFGYNGLGRNEYGIWLIRGGCVDFGYTGDFGGTKIINGKAQV